MTTLIETLASRFQWRICRANVIVEGTSDVAMLELADALYFGRFGVRLLGRECAILAAGYGDDGGVEGVNRKLHLVRQLVEADPGPDGKLKYRFIGLYDNDPAGRRAIDIITRFDSRVRRFGEVFSLHPVMSMKRGADPKSLAERFARDNIAYRGLDWEIEDLLSVDLHRAFHADYPTAVLSLSQVSDKIHRNMSRDGKRRLLEFAKSYATIDDLLEVVKLIRSLRDYLHLQCDHVIVTDS